jgi:methionine synthase I (cobalamin-dependent)
MSRLLSLFPPRLVITDGAWGTELQKRGLPIGQPADLWNLTRPDEVGAVARSYVEAGSQVILTNTFRANPVALRAHGLEHQSSAINRRGAELSREQAGSDVFIFGSMGPIGHSIALREMDGQSVLDAFRTQAQALAEGGVDALLLETFSDIEEARLAVQAVRPTGLPIVVSFAFGSGGQHDQTSSGVGPETAARAMVQERVDAIGANCGTGPQSFGTICRRLQKAAELPIWLKPSAGIPSIQDGRVVYPATPDDFTAFLWSLPLGGATFLGGCCGTTPEFIRAMVRTAALIHS